MASRPAARLRGLLSRSPLAQILLIILGLAALALLAEYSGLSGG